MVQAFTLVPVNHNNLMEITPKNWHRYPVPVPAGGLGRVWIRQQQVLGGAFGDDVSQSTATYVTDKIAANGPNTATDYSPRNAQQKATALGLTFGNIVNAPRGSITAKTPYPTASSPAPQAPTITSLNPATLASGAGQPDRFCVITGTNFTQFSSVMAGNYPVPVQYVSPTTLEFLLQPSRSVPGTITVTVTDHGVTTAATNFVYT